MTTTSSTPRDNPPPAYSGSEPKKIPSEPLYGFVPRRVAAKQVQVALVREDPRNATEKKLTKPQDGDVNPFNKRPHSPQYKRILEVRKKLPVYVQMSEFYEMVSILPSI